MNKITDSKIYLSDFFAGDSLNRILTYKEQLQSIIDEHDLVVFMARKAICFFDALVRNGEVEPNYEKCEITTNRIFTYNITSLTKKKIAIIDDIVVRGKTLKETIEKINRFTESFDIFFLAYEPSDNLSSVISDKRLITAPVKLKKEENLTLSNGITNYINASMSSYNIDYPVFYFTTTEKRFQEEKIKLSCFTISNSIQEYFDIDVSIQTIIQKEKSLFFNIIPSTDLAMKVRLFFDTNRIKDNLIAIPIVLFPKLTDQQLEDIFILFSNDDILKMISHSMYIKENQLKWLQYVVSFSLFQTLKKQGYLNFGDAYYNIEKQKWIFPLEYVHIVEKQLFNVELFPELSIDSPRFNTFDIAEVFVDFQLILQQIHHLDSSHEGLKEITFDSITNECSSQHYDPIKCRYIISNVFDIAIDKGLIIPYIKTEGLYTYRAYRLGEQYELIEKHFDLFAYMLSDYFDKSYYSQKPIVTVKLLPKTAVEKLMVIFFKKVIPSISKCKSENPDNLFSVHFTRFGPVVSTGEKLYEVTDHKQLSVKLTATKDKPNYFTRISEKKGMYEIPEKVAFQLDETWKEEASFFSSDYGVLSKVFNTLEHRPTLIQTFDKFLVLEAIGENPKNKYLSLLAELRLFENFNLSIKPPITVAILRNFYYVLSGLTSGMWKYFCFYGDDKKNVIASMIQLFISKDKRKTDIEFELEEIRKKITYLLQRIKKATIFQNNKISNQLSLPKIISYIESFNKYLQNSKQPVNDSYNYKEKSAVDKELLAYLSEVISQYIIFEYSEIERFREIEQRLIRELNNIALFLSVRENFRRATKLETISINPHIASEIGKRMDKAVSLICELLYYWNCLKDISPDEYNSLKMSLDPNQIREYDPDENNRGYIEKLKHILPVTFVSNKHIIDRLNEINKETEFLITEYDACFKNDIYKESIALSSIVVIKHRFNESIPCNTLSQEKTNNEKLERFLGVSENDSVLVTEVGNDATIQLISEINSHHCCSIYIFTFSKEYNQCLIDCNGKGINPRFKNLVYKYALSCTDAAEMYLVTDITQDNDYTVIITKSLYNTHFTNPLGEFINSHTFKQRLIEHKKKMELNGLSQNQLDKCQDIINKISYDLTQEELKRLYDDTQEIGYSYIEKET